MVKSFFCLLVLLIIFPSFLLSRDNIVILKAKGSYYIVNGGHKQGLKKQQLLNVKRETPEGFKNVATVRVIAITGNLAAVVPLSKSLPGILKIGDKLSLTEEGNDSLKVEQPQRKEVPQFPLPQTDQSRSPRPQNLALADLRVGSWVEVQGPVKKTETSVAPSQIDEIESESSFTPDKMEITGLATSDLTTNGKDFQVLDYVVTVSEKTRFENASRTDVPRFAVHKNDWVKVKVRVKEDGGLFARVIRRIEPRGRFKIFGQVRAVTLPLSKVMIGGVELAVPPDADLNFVDEVTQGNPIDGFVQDEQKGVLFGVRPAPNLLIGGQVSSEARVDNERDLAPERKRDKQILAGGLKLVLLWRINSNGLFTFTEGTFGIREELRNQSHEQTNYPRRLSQAYIYWPFSKFASFQIGRQDFDDEREWIYDEALDGIRLRTQLAPLELEISGGFGREFLDLKNNTEGLVHAMGILRAYLNPDHFLSVYNLHLRRRNVESFHYNLSGLRSYGRPRRGLRHWLELAIAFGQNGPKGMDGYAVDFGLSNVFDVHLQPTITAGVAYASGDKNLEDQSGGFHQTGLQDNNDKFGGITSFRYYGEVFDPELSNRIITTAGFGLRPSRNFSTDLVFHTYHQDQASTDLGDTRLRVKPTGQSKYLGWELDLILGYRFRKRFNMELILGRFEPGRAFTQNVPAHIAQFQTRVKF